MRRLSLFTVEMAVRRNGGRLPGVAAVRSAIVSALFAYQSLEVSASYGRLANTAIWTIPALMVPALFALSGFLLAQSLDRSDVRSFWRRRFLHNWPVLALSVVLSALIIGPLATDMRLADYFSDRGLYFFLLNLVAIPVETLPGVFTSNAIATVNDIYWATPFAFAGMAILTAAALRRQSTTAILAAVLAALVAAALALQLFEITLPFDRAFVRSALAGNGLAALLCLILGALAWHLRRWLPCNPIIAVAAAAAVAGGALLGGRDWGDLAAFNTLVSVPLTCLVIILALSPLPFAPAAAVAQNYLAGILLFAYPVQQLVVASGLVGTSFIANIAASLPITALIAVLAWHLVQRRGFAHHGSGASIDESLPRPWQPPSLAMIWRRGVDLAPTLALWTAFVLIAIAAMAMTMFAFTAESQGI
jgi:peptidoglycan/LPS O-acetylase OafA/YrhL